MLILGLALVSAIGSSALAKEGFEVSPLGLPKGVQSAWAATFGVISGSSKKIERGSASLIKIEERGLRLKLYFLTADHVIIDEICKESGYCDFTTLHQSLEFDATSFYAYDSAQELLLGLSFKDVFLEKRDAKFDLALLSVEVDKRLLPKLPRPIPISRNCYKPSNEYFAIGFPGTWVRESSSRPILLKQLALKRVSSGIFINIYQSPTSDRVVLFGTSVDALPGNSGGPLLSKEGYLHGVISQGSASREYSGSEVLEKLDWQALSTHCLDVTHFLSSERAFRTRVSIPD